MRSEPEPAWTARPPQRTVTLSIHRDLGVGRVLANEGRHQGGRAPYGYVVADGGPHPNPRKAAEGFRLRVFAIDGESAEVVRRIFAEYLEGNGDRAIAKGLNQDGVPCPSARWPDQNTHWLADGWQGSTVRSIVENPRYTGYAIFGRWAKHETLLRPTWS